MKRKRNIDKTEKKSSSSCKKQQLVVNNDGKLPGDIISQIIVDTIPFPIKWIVQDKSKAVREMLANPKRNVEFAALHHKQFCKIFNLLLVSKQWYIELLKLKEIYRNARYSFEISLLSSMSIDEDGIKTCYYDLAITKIYAYSTREEVVDAYLKMHKNVTQFKYIDWWVYHILKRIKTWRI